MQDLAKVSRTASKRLFEIKGKDNIAAWAGFVWYGVLGFPEAASRLRVAYRFTKSHVAHEKMEGSRLALPRRL